MHDSLHDPVFFPKKKNYCIIMHQLQYIYY